MIVIKNLPDILTHSGLLAQLIVRNSHILLFQAAVII